MRERYDLQRSNILKVLNKGNITYNAIFYPGTAPADVAHPLQLPHGLLSQPKDHHFFEISCLQYTNYFLSLIDFFIIQLSLVRLVRKPGLLKAPVFYLNNLL